MRLLAVAVLAVLAASALATERIGMEGMAVSMRLQTRTIGSNMAEILFCIRVPGSSTTVNTHSNMPTTCSNTSLLYIPPPHPTPPHPPPARTRDHLPRQPPRRLRRARRPRRPGPGALRRGRRLSFRAGGEGHAAPAGAVRALGARRLRALRPGALRAPGPGLELRLRVPEALDLN